MSLKSPAWVSELRHCGSRWPRCLRDRGQRVTLLSAGKLPDRLQEVRRFIYPTRSRKLTIQS